MSIYLQRDNHNVIHVNVEHNIHRHSDSFDWGNLSPESLELALNILNLYCDNLTRERLYKKFASDIISDIPFGGATMSNEDIEAWIAANIHFQLKREPNKYMIAVYKEETNENVISTVVAFHEVEAIVYACELSYDKDLINEMVNKYINDYNGIVEYYRARGVFFSEPIVANLLNFKNE